MATATLLTAKVSLTKRFSRNGESYDVEAYPLVRNVTSTTRSYSNLDDLYSIIMAGANAGCCLQKGGLDRPLVDESRQGHTNPLEPTDLLVIDWDCTDGFRDPDDLLSTLDPALEDVSYIWQMSSSAGITHETTVRGHAFIMLESPLNPALIKEWCLKLNFTIPQLRSRLSLSRTAMSLRYPLDVTVNQNDKLIYIAPPKCVNFSDPIPTEDRIRIVRKEFQTFRLQPDINPQRTRELHDEILKELQEKAGLKYRAPKRTAYKNWEVITNPAICTVTEEKDCGDYIRLNLNGGNSFAYWYYKDDPEILHNFKGEDPAFLRDICPTYYAERVAQTPKDRSIRPIIFRDPVTDTYYNGIADFDEKDILKLHAAGSKDRLFDFLAQFGQKPPKYIEDWTVTYDPTSIDRFLPEKRWVNKFVGTEFMEPTDDKTDFPIIDKVLRHICVDEETHRYFVNWIAFILQERKMTQSAWLFHGTEGTGKGTLFHQILRPLLGSSNTQIIENRDLKDNFNEFVSEKLLVFLDEGDVKSTREADTIMAKLRTYITEKTIPIRGMRKSTIDRENFSNWIVASNEIGAIKLRMADRRWNIAPRQNEKLYITSQEVRQIATELRPFANFLLAHSVDLEMITYPLKNEAKTDLAMLSRTGADIFFESIKVGKLDYFMDYVMQEPPIPANGYFEFETILRKWIASAGTATFIRCAEELKPVYEYISGQQINPQKFGYLLRAQGLNVKRHRVDGYPTRGLEVNFEENAFHRLPERKTNVVQFGKPAA